MQLEEEHCGFLGILMKLSFVFVCWLEWSLWRSNEHVMLHKVLQSWRRGLTMCDSSPEVAVSLGNHRRDNGQIFDWQISVLGIQQRGLSDLNTLGFKDFRLVNRLLSLRLGLSNEADTRFSLASSMVCMNPLLLLSLYQVSMDSLCPRLQMVFQRGFNFPKESLNA